MRIKSLEELREVDEMSARFTPTGFSTAGVMRPEDAVRTHQESIASADLVEAVTESTTQAFARLRDVHAHGVLLYDLYSCVEQLQSFVLEQALRDRFITFYDGEVPFKAKDGSPAPLRAETFDDVFEAIGKPGGSHKKAKQLELNGTSLNFRGYLRDLIEWARAAGLLRGERNRYRESIWIEMRNHFAHPSGHTVVGPIESSQSIRRLSETINHLWGSETIGGDLYPAPIKREVLAIGWPKEGESIVTLYADQLYPKPDKADWEYIILRAHREDGGLPDFDSCFELTNAPAELLWGPGQIAAAIDWLQQSNPQPDYVDYLDRPFAIKIEGSRCGLPRRVAVAAGLTGAQRTGLWHLVRADASMDAFSHTRSLLSEATECSASPNGCPNCAATTLHVGSLEEVVGFHRDAVGSVTPETPRQLRTRVPWRP